MKVKQVTASKNYKIGLPNYSNMDVGLTMTFEVGEGEQIDWNEVWDTMNQQLLIQGGTVDQSWMKVQELREHWKVTVKIPKSHGAVKMADRLESSAPNGSL